MSRPAAATALQRLGRALTLGAPSYDPGQERRIRRMLRDLGSGARVLDLGSGGRNWGPTVIGMDVSPHPQVKVLGDGHRLPFRDDQLDAVLCTGVLEHVEDAERVTAEIWRVLRPGGLVYVAVPFLQGYHAASGTEQDFRRLTHVGLRRVLSRFTERETGVSGGPSSALAWVLREYLALLVGGPGRLYSLAYLLSGWLTVWIKYFDSVTASRPLAYRVACGFYFIGSKAGAGRSSVGWA
ncbi:MAG TPA: class I SAM-dependent methyltransferase [Candidatus Sulfotelmatobacter sp.]|nr:class I SAM-dependent methyltransferase [Candidatus Sulfotelmatobacter sp.]